MHYKLGSLVSCFLGITSFYSAKHQLDEKKDKQKFRQLMDQRINDAPIECPAHLSNSQICTDYKYKRVSVSGTIDPRNTFIIGPQTRPETSPWYKILHPNSWGSYIYSSLQTASGHTVIVNRGWVPRDKLKEYHKHLDSEESHAHYQEYEGVISPLKVTELFEINSAAIHTVWQFKDNHLTQLMNAAVDNGITDHDYIVVDILQPQQEYGEYPHRLSKEDIFGMVGASPQQHLTYAMALITSGFMCCGLGMILVRYPHGIRYINRTGVHMHI